MAQKHSKFFDSIQRYYNLYISSGGETGYSKETVYSFVNNGRVTSITPEEYKEITVEDYVA